MILITSGFYSTWTLGMDCPECGNESWNSSGFEACRVCGWSEANDILNMEIDDDDVMVDDYIPDE